MTPSEEIRADFARIRQRYEGCDIAGVKMSTIARLEKRFNELEAQTPGPCPHCGETPTFDMVAHLEAPSRSNPIAAAFAVNMRRSVL